MHNFLLRVFHCPNTLPYLGPQDAITFPTSCVLETGKRSHATSHQLPTSFAASAPYHTETQRPYSCPIRLACHYVGRCFPSPVKACAVTPKLIPAADRLGSSPYSSTVTIMPSSTVKQTLLISSKATRSSTNECSGYGSLRNNEDRIRRHREMAPHCGCIRRRAADCFVGRALGASFPGQRASEDAYRYAYVRIVRLRLSARVIMGVIMIMAALYLGYRAP